MLISFIPAFKDNYIWLLTTPDGRAAVVDPGDAGPVRERLAHDGLRLEAILLTHHHADHTDGVASLATGDVAVHASEIESITGCTHPLRGGERFRLFGEEIEVLSVPGHTRGHLAYRLGKALFCGDTLFTAGCGRLFEGTPAQMYDSLQRIAQLPDDTLIYCAHEYTTLNLPFASLVEPGNAALRERVASVAARRARGEPTVPSTLAEEKATNPFLRCTVPEVVASAVAHGAADSTPLAVFTELRAWRNVF